MTSIMWRFMRASGWSRAALIAACTALIAGLLLVAVAILRLPAEPKEILSPLVVQTGLRGGTVLGVCLLLIPLLLLLYQVVRLGTAARERRLAALRVAGATLGEVRRIGAVEVGVPVTVGAVLGIAVYVVLRSVFGGVGWGGYGFVAGRVQELMLVPTTVTPAWWQAVLVIAGVAVLGILTGWRASRHVAVDPLGVSQRRPSSRPRPWGVLPLGVAAVIAVIGFSFLSSTTSSDAMTAAGIVAVALAVVGILGLTSWSAYRVARFAEKHTDSVATLLAARRLVSDPRPAGRAAAAIGAICLIAGGSAAIGAKVVGGMYVDVFMLASLGLVFAGLASALAVTTFTLVVHLVETLLERRRPLAALAAAGTPVKVLEEAQRRELALAAFPSAIGGYVLGALALGSLSVRDAGGTAILLVVGTATVAAVWFAIWIGGRVMRPWLARATAPGNLRTE